MDLATPRNVQLSGFFRRSSAVRNAREHIPNSLDTIAKELSSKISDIRLQYGEEASDEMSNIVTKINLLRDEVLGDVPFRKINSDAPDAKFYNDYLEKMNSEDCRPTMLQTIRIFAECYVYRRVWECFEMTTHFKNFDPFHSMKIEINEIVVPLIHKTARYLRNIYKYPSEEDKDDFEKLIKLLLWSNQSDLMQSKEFVLKYLTQILKVKARDVFIISNQLEEAWEIISDKSHASDVIAIICNNVGFELFMKLCVADYLYTNYYARKIHFHVKHVPWFQTDTTEADIHWMLQDLSKSSDKLVQQFASEWKKHFEAGRWKIIARKYWTLPIGFSQMKYMDSVLYKMLEDTKIIIVSGDMNYRKLLDDTNFNPSANFSEILCDFQPSNLMMIRVIKSGIICNVDPNDIQRVESLDKSWIESGQYGLIQFAHKITPPCDCLKT